VSSTNVKPIATFSLSDDALVTYGAPVAGGGLAFHDTGDMAITSITALTLGLGINLGQGVGLFVHYESDGVLLPNARGDAVIYHNLHYELEAYTGQAKFTRGPDGSPIVTGARNLVTLATGDLINGGLELTTGPTGVTGVTGEIDATFNLGKTTVGKFAINIAHAATDIGYTADGLTLSGGTSTASLIPVTPHLIG
jgi:hypothetical protein